MIRTTPRRVLKSVRGRGASQPVTAALSLENLHFGYGRRAAVRGVSLQLAPGDCYGFLGHNGAGKTTVMRLCLGLLRPAKGRVLVFGRDAQQERRRANANIGAVIERPGFHNHVTARDNLVALARLQGLAPKLAVAEAERVLDRTGMTYAAQRRVGTFSMGMRQRLGIAQALLGRPKVLLLDEPTNGLDPEGIAELRALLRRLTREERVAVMLSSHQLAELEGLCNRVGVLRDGEMLVEGDLATLRRRVSMRHVITGDLDALQRQLAQLDLMAERDGDRLLVDLGDRAPGDVTRALAAAAELTSFAPEQATLERIYLQAGAGAFADAAPVAGERDNARIDDDAPTRSGYGSPQRPQWRSFRYELTTMLRKRSTLPLLLAPCAVAVVSVNRYVGAVQQGLRQVELEERFSADAGSGFLATAQALQSATPALCFALLWFASQTIAADRSNDTLRNSLVRSLRRQDVLCGKLGVLFGAMLVGWAALVAATMATSALTVGFGDLEEISRYGDRDLLAASAEVWPTMLTSLFQMILPLAALTSIAAAMSATTRLPALALALACGAALLPEMVRGMLDERAGYLLTSHLPLLWQDDSAIGYSAAVARGAADALWRWADFAVLAPVLWLALGIALLAVLLQRMRIR